MPPAHLGNVVDGRDHSGESLVVLGAGFPTVRDFVGRGPNLVGMQFLEKLRFSVEHADMRTEKLVGRAGQEVAIDRLHVDRAVRSVVNGVNEAQSSRFVSGSRDRGNIVDGSDGVRGVADGHEFRSLIDQRVESIEVERAVFDVHVGGVNDGAALFQGPPRGDVRIVIELRDDDLVTLFQLASDGAAESERKGRHVGAERDLVGTASQKVARRRVGLAKHSFGAFGRGECTVSIGVRGR